MGLLDKMNEVFGFRSFGELQDVRPEKRAEMAKRKLHGEKGEDARKNIEVSLRIFKMTGQTPVEKLRMQETRELKLKDGTAWLNLVLALYEQDKSIVGEVLDLPTEVRIVLAQEKTKRAEMPEAKQKLLDAAIYTVEKKSIFNIPQAQPEPVIEEKKAA